MEFDVTAAAHRCAGIPLVFVAEAVASVETSVAVGVLISVLVVAGAVAPPA
jgi:hypothetical protein